MRKAACIVFLVASVLLFSGCVEVVYEIGVDDNDVEHLTMRTGMPALLAPYLGEVIAKVQSEGFVVKTDTQGDKVWIIGTKEYKKGQWDLPALPSSVTITSVARDSFRVDDYVLFKKYLVDVEYQYESNSKGGEAAGPIPQTESMYAIPVKFVIKLPGRITETNAHERQGEAAVWNYTLAQNGTITMKLVTYKVKWGLAAALLASGMIFVGAVVLVISRSSRARPSFAPVPTRPKASPVRAEAITPSPVRTGGPVVDSASPSPGPGISSAPTGSPTAAGDTYYVVTLSLPQDTARVEKIIQTLARSKSLTIEQTIAELRARRLTIRFSDKAILDKNLGILRDGGFDPKVTVLKR